MTTIHNLGFPRIGAQRELKLAVEAYWRGETDRDRLLETGRELRARHWQQQADAGLNLLPVGDFSWYDQVLDTSLMLGVIPPRFAVTNDTHPVDAAFLLARGRASGLPPAAACEMTKWFDTNYHYLVPEFQAGQSFHLADTRLFDEIIEARAQGHNVKPVLLGPLSFLWLGKSHDGEFDRLSLLDALVPVYQQILERLQALHIEWVQIDEPILALDLPSAWQRAFESVYTRLQLRGLNKLLTVYFGPLRDNLQLACSLPVEGLHIDAVRGADEIGTVIDWLPDYRVLSLGVIDGRNVWRADLDTLLDRLEPLHERLGDRLWLAPSCSLLHVPVDLEQETDLDDELRSWLAFAVQKLDELAILGKALDHGRAACAGALTRARAACNSRRQSPRIHRPDVRQRCESIDAAMSQRKRPFGQRIQTQHARLHLPLLPTTTIGSFPQTAEIRQTRRRYRQGEIGEAVYHEAMQAEIGRVIAFQENIGLDVLVHGEPERNDMVEYFGEQLQGFAFTRHGWVQSYGSRCVKPPIIYGDVSRPAPMTVDWIRHAQSLTQRPVKGMLTGPVTMLNWSFARDDQPRAETCRQIALALRDEVLDLEAAGIGIIQIDEAALREGLPLRRGDWQAYLDKAIEAFRITASGVADETQIHTHMCYSEFNDIMPAIAAMDADVITIETSRSHMELLDAFREFDYPNEIGPGVYDIHSPNVPKVEDIVTLIEKAMQYIPIERLWINPDCGLKTRDWPEVEAALRNMVSAARILRERYGAERAG